MKPLCFSITIAVLGLIAPAAFETPANGLDAVDTDEGIEVLARGPVHEAYAAPARSQSEYGSAVKKQPPPPIEELPPDQKPDADSVLWIPGYWAWEDDPGEFIWVSGTWRVPPPGREWLPGHWQEVDEGWMWVSGYWMPADAAELEYLAHPPPTLEKGPSTPAPDKTSIYTAGIWVYRDGRYQWRPGQWFAPRAGWVWIPAYYVCTPTGCTFVEGYWDHPMYDRGLLYTPARIDLVLWKPTHGYTPQYVVHHDFLLGALFVGPYARHYYFGDYFDERYRKQGFVPWFDFRVGPDIYDPTYDYYRRLHEPQWEPALRDLYAARRKGDVPRPPRTLALQLQAVKDIAAKKTGDALIHKNIHLTHAENVTVLAPMKEVPNLKLTHLRSLSPEKDPKLPGIVLKLKPLAKEELDRERKVAARIREAAQKRRDAEAKLLARGEVPEKPGDPPKKVKLDLPAPPPPVTPLPKPRKEPPAALPPPKVEEKPIPKYDPPKRPAPPKPKNEKPKPGPKE